MVSNYPRSVPKAYEIMHPHRGAVALLLSNRQIRQEATSLFYHLSTFNISSFTNAADLIAILGKDRCAMVTSIVMDASLASVVAECMYRRWFLLNPEPRAIKQVRVEGSWSLSLDERDMAGYLRTYFKKEDLQITFELQ